MAARALVIAALVVSCKADRPLDKRTSAPSLCPESGCRDVPSGLAGVDLGVSPDQATQVIGELIEVTPRSAIACITGVVSYQVHTEVGGDRARCELDFIEGKLDAIECSLDGERDGDEHVAIAWALYQTLARQFDNADELDDKLEDDRRLTAQWPEADRVLTLNAAYFAPRSIIRFAVRSRVARRSCFDYQSPVFAREPMIERARSYLRDLTGPLEGDPP